MYSSLGKPSALLTVARKLLAPQPARARPWSSTPSRRDHPVRLRPHNSLRKKSPARKLVFCWFGLWAAKSIFLFLVFPTGPTGNWTESVAAPGLFHAWGLFPSDPTTLPWVPGSEPRVCRGWASAGGLPAPGARLLPPITQTTGISTHSSFGPWRTRPRVASGLACVP